jgi:hypothetical protein
MLNCFDVDYRRLVLLLFLGIFSGLTIACGAAFEPSVPQAVVDRDGGADYAAEAAPVEGAAAPAPAIAPGSSTGYVDGQSIPLEDYLAGAVTQAEGIRVIIYTGNISLVVKDTPEAIEVISGLANEQGGFVAGSDVYQSNTVLRGSITIRVPAERYQDTLTQLREFALRVERENSSTQDVTEEFTDLQARKTNLEFTEEALQKLLDERQRVGSTSDILEVHRELTNIRGQIEQIEGRLRYLANQSALSTISIELIPDVLYQPVSIAGWEPQGVAKEALQALVVALQGLVNVLIWLVIFVLPLLIVLLIPVAIVVLVVRWWWKRYKARKKAAEQTAIATDA